MHYFLVIGFCTLVAGCSSETSERLAYQESPDQRHDAHCFGRAVSPA
jgi:hypothetical protein